MALYLTEDILELNSQQPNVFSPSAPTGPFLLKYIKYVTGNV